MLFAVRQRQVRLQCSFIEAVGQRQPLRKVDANLGNLLLFPGELGGVGVADERFARPGGFQDFTQQRPGPSRLRLPVRGSGDNLWRA